MQELLEAIAEPRRREILRLVRSDELPAGAIAAHFADVTRPAISQHLRVLREAGLLAERRDGTRRLYSARPGGLRRPARVRVPVLGRPGCEVLRSEAHTEQRRRHHADHRN